MAVAVLRDRLQRDMTTFAGVLRDGAGLEQAARAVAAVEAALGGAQPEDGFAGAARSAEGRDVAELRSLVTLAGVVVSAATEREESRGCHHRLDFPEPRQPLERIVYFGADRRVRVPAATAVSELER